MKKTRGWSLVEITIVFAIVGLILVIAIPAFTDSLRRANALKNKACVHTAAAAVSAYYSNLSVTTALPLTEPAASVPYTGGTPAARSYAMLDHVLLAVGSLSQPLAWGHRTPIARFEGLGIAYNNAAAAFIDSPPVNAVVTAAFTATPPPHLESRLSNPAIAPSAAAGANFRVNGETDLPANAVVVFAVLPDISSRDALALAQEILPVDRAPALGLACDTGAIAFPAADASGNTTVYLYIAHR